MVLNTWTFILLSVGSDTSYGSPTVDLSLGAYTVIAERFLDALEKQHLNCNGEKVPNLFFLTCGLNHSNISLLAESSQNYALDVCSLLGEYLLIYK